MKYIVFIDIDNTLYYCFEMNPKNEYAIKKARENGHLVFLNTGRSTGVIHDELMHGLFDGIVSSIGGEVYVGDKTLVKELLPLSDVIKYGEEFLAEERMFIFEATAARPVKSVKSTDIDPMRLIKTSKAEFTKLYIEGKISPEKAEEISKKYQLYIHPGYFEFTTKDCNKATGMAKVMEYLGIPKENSIAMGDSVNDVEMLAAAGIPVCVENASPEIKKMCVYETCHAKDGAVYDCFLKFGLI